MTPLAELKEIQLNRLQTLQVYESMLAAVMASCVIGAVVLAILTIHSGDDWTASAILCLCAGIFASWIRNGVRKAIKRQFERLKDLDELIRSEPPPPPPPPPRR